MLVDLRASIVGIRFLWIYACLMTETGQVTAIRNTMETPKSGDDTGGSLH